LKRDLLVEIWKNGEKKRASESRLCIFQKTKAEHGAKRHGAKRRATLEGGALTCAGLSTCMRRRDTTWCLKVGEKRLCNTK
jgi:hypothetical protein